MASIVTAVAFGGLVRIVRPYLVADHPAVLALLDGGYATIGAAGALSSVGQLPIWLVLVMGTLGMMKFQWLTWWAGRRWGVGLLGYVMRTERAERWAARFQVAPRWAISLAVVLAALPTTPGAAIHALAGCARMRLVSFLIFSFIGAALTTGLLTIAGYAMGQTGVDLILLVDHYAGWVTLGLIGLTVGLPSARALVRKARPKSNRRQLT